MEIAKSAPLKGEIKIRKAPDEGLFFFALLLSVRPFQILLS